MFHCNNYTRNEKILKLYQRCLLTFLILVVYRILCTIPTPGVNRDFFNLMINSNATLGLLNVFSGNSLMSLSIMALNVTPYITATIIMQLFQSAIEPLKRLAKGTPKDKKKFSLITIVVTAVFAFIQAFGMATLFGKRGLLVEYSVFWIIIVTVIWTSTSVILAIIGKKIDENKNLFVGRGISLFLVTNILASFPNNIHEIYNTFIEGKNNTIMLCIIGILILFAIFTIISFLHETEKRIVVSYASNVVYENIQGSPKKQIIPIKLMPASVMPVIFTSAIFSIPILISLFIGNSDLEWVKFLNTMYWFNPENMIYSLGCIIYIFLIFVFSYFYINISLNPYEIAEDLQKAGGFIENLRTNTETAKYLKKHIYQMATFGAIILSIITIIPFVLSGIFGLSKMSFLGTSILIIVAVIIETFKDISASKNVECHNNKNGGLFSYETSK